VDSKKVGITGDIMCDAALYYCEKNTRQITEKDFILLTLHRAENTDNPDRLKSIVQAVNEISDHRFIFPVHPRTIKMLKQQNFVFSGHVKMIEPVGYLEMLAYESACSAVLTDSGDVQKEAFFFHKPCITLRDATEWVELVQSGWNILARADRGKIIYAVRNLKIPAIHPDFYGDGHAAEKILSYLC
jgi:UDP-GlcNAc3NAcA epimerase